MTQHLELFFSLTSGSLPEENDTSSTGMEWPHVTEPITALAFPPCKPQGFCSQEHPLFSALLWSKFSGSWPHSPNNLLCIHPSVMLQLCRNQSFVGFRMAQTWEPKQHCSSESELEHSGSFKDIQCFMSLTWFSINKLPAPLSFLKRETTPFFDYSWFESKRNGKGKRTAALISRVRGQYKKNLSEYCTEYLFRMHSSEGCNSRLIMIKFRFHFGSSQMMLL